MNAQSNFKANLDSRTVDTYVPYIFDHTCIHMFKCLPTVKGGGTIPSFWHPKTTMITNDLGFRSRQNGLW